MPAEKPRLQRLVNVVLVVLVGADGLADRRQHDAPIVGVLLGRASAPHRLDAELNSAAFVLPEVLAEAVRVAQQQLAPVHGAVPDARAHFSLLTAAARTTVAAQQCACSCSACPTRRKDLAADDSGNASRPKFRETASISIRCRHILRTGTPSCAQP